MPDDFLRRFGRFLEQGRTQEPQTGRPAPDGAATGADEQAPPDRRAPDGAATGADEEAALPGQRVDTPFGHVQVLATRVHLPLLLPPRVTGAAGRLKDRRLAGFDRQQALFFDVEATGLSHGAGTVAFLLGLGRFDGDDLVVEQVLLADYDEECAQLQLLLERLSQTTYLVSYNGKSYDTSVLANRLVVNRFMDREEAQLKLRPHLDLLHLGRRLYSGLLPDHTLATLEREVLRRPRLDDLPGELVPQHYFQYLLTRDPSYLAPVLAHNLQDVVSLALLAHEMLLLLADGSQERRVRLCFNIGKTLADGGFFAEALPHLRIGMTRDEPDLALPAARLLARALRKLSARPEELLAVWEELLAIAGERMDPAERDEVQRRVERLRKALRQS
jgi:uncharacterized protein YprB with RNaseH-like and TPR domain